jgi:cytochrome b561
MNFILSALTGWLAAIVLCVGAALPFVLRRTSGGDKTFAERLRLHYWLGFSIPAITFLHAWIPMSAGMARGVNATGLWLATVALLLMLIQIAWGVALRTAARAGRTAGRNAARKTHFWMMTVIAALSAVHVILDRA